MTFLLSAGLASCSKPAYVPAGEIYSKMSPALGDSGVVDVVDMELDKAVYASEGELTVSVKLGVGHRPHRNDSPDGEGYAYLLIRARYNTTPAGEFLEIGRLDFPDYETAKYNSTEPEPDRSFLFMPIYGDFYPTYRESMDWTIPADATSGYIKAELHVVDDYGNVFGYTTHCPEIRFERIGGEVHFSADE